MKETRVVAAVMCSALLLALCGCAGVCGGPSGGVDVDGLMARHAPAVVPLKIVRSTKVSFQGREAPAREQESEVLGTVLNAAGLIVASNTAVDPAAAQVSARPGIKIESEVKSAKLINTGDGTETTLKIVLRDKELDLVFLRPEKAATLPNVGLAGEGAALRTAQEVVVLSRLGAVGDRQPSVILGRVQAVIRKPRTFYVTDLLSSVTALGCPAFDADGRLIGVLVIRTSKAGSSGGMLGGLGSRMLPVILPAADILEDLKQIEENEED